MKRAIQNLFSSKYFFIGSVILLHLLFFIWQVIHGNFYLRDSYEYLSASANLKSNFVLYSGNLNEPLNFALYTKRPPLYPLFIAFCQIFSKNILFVIFIQNILSVWGIWLVRDILLRYGYSIKYDSFFLLFLLLTPSQFIYSNLVMSENLLQFLVVLLIYFLIKYLTSKRLVNAIWYTVILTLCAFTKPVFVYFLYLNIIVFIFICFKKTELKHAVVSLIPLFFLFSYQYRNFKITGVSQVSSIETINLLDYNVYQFLVKTRGAEIADSTVNKIDSLSNLRGTFKDMVTYKNQKSKAIILAEPLKYSFFHLKGVVGFFIDPGRFDLVNFFNLNAEKTDGLLYQLNKNGIKGSLLFMLEHSFLLLMAMIIIVISNVIKLLLFVLLIFKIEIKNIVLLYAIMLIFYIAILTGPLGASRFMMPLIPLYIGCCLIYLSTRKENNLSNL